MDYPYDTPDVSPFTRATLELWREAPLLTAPVRLFVEALEGDLSPEAAALLHTLAHHARPRADLVWRELYGQYDDSEGELEEPMGAWEDYNVPEDDPGAFDTTKAALLGCSAGGEVTFGFTWDGGALRFFEVDVEDEEGAPLKIFDSADAFWDHVAQSEYDHAEMEGEAAPAFLLALFGRAGATLAWPE